MITEKDFRVTYRGQTEKFPSEKERHALSAQIEKDIDSFIKAGGKIKVFPTTRSKWTTYEEYGRNTYDAMMEKKKRLGR